MQSPRWYLNRLRAMSLAELGARARRQARYMLEWSGALRVGRTPPPSWPPSRSFEWPAGNGGKRAALLSSADRIAEGWFEFFGERFHAPGGPRWNVDPKTGTQAPLVFGKSLDYRDARLVGDIKYLWELNRHLELVPLAQAYASSGEIRYLESLRALVGSWIDQSPYLRGPNWCSSLELAIRLINWQFAFVIAGGGGSPMFKGAEGERFAAAWADSVYRHVHFIMSHLSSHSSANNHLIGELAGVYVAASAWSCWPEMEQWKQRAHELLVEQMREQTHVDGVNKEQAVWYQQFVMYFFWVAGLVGSRVEDPFPEDYWRGLYRMTSFLDALIDTAGNVPMIGDADDGIVFALVPKRDLDPFLELLAIAGMFFDEPRWTAKAADHCATAAWLCGDTAPMSIGMDQPHPRQFPAGGYYVLGDRLGEPDEVRLVADAGPLGYLSIAAHGHADCLAFTLTVAGKEILVDSGTYSYHTEHAWRDYFRGTAAHNTVRVDERDQSEISGPFMWAQKAQARVEAFQSSPTRDYLKASHDGYRRLSDPVTHVREIMLDKIARQVEIVDEIQCRGRHLVEQCWHFSESCTISLSGTAAEASNGDVLVEVRALDPGIEGRLMRGSTQPPGGWISRRFGDKEATSTVVYSCRIDGTSRISTRIRLPPTKL